jgi:hypothetical protein
LWLAVSHSKGPESIAINGPQKYLVALLWDTASHKGPTDFISLF